MFLFRTLYIHMKDVYKLNVLSDEERLEVRRAMLALFNDNSNAPFSLHNICEKGKEKGFGDVGQYWKQNLTLASVIDVLKEQTPMYVNKKIIVQTLFY